VSKSSPTQKSFVISKQLVWEAYQRVKANQGAPGVDGQSIVDFESDLKNNLYRVWNWMSSGTRMLGMPTVGDRIAQTVVALTLEPRTEQIFHADSYGYRPGKSAHQALTACRERC
jgi:RNA-directed DNA polymerase